MIRRALAWWTKRLPCRRGRRGKRGISLLEAMIAMTIMGISATAILTAFSAALVSGKDAERYASAVLLAQTLNAQLRMGEFSPSEVMTGTSVDEFYAWSVTFQETDLLDLYRVTLNVSWKRGSGLSTISVDTLHYQELEDLL